MTPPKTVIANITSRRWDLIKRDPSADEAFRVSVTEVRKSSTPHQWQRVARKPRSSVEHWACAKCGGWVQLPAGTRPNVHFTPTCAELTVKQVHDL